MTEYDDAAIAAIKTLAERAGVPLDLLASGTPVTSEMTRQVVAANEAKLAERQARFEWMEQRLAAAGVTAETHMVKFDGTVLEKEATERIVKRAAYDALKVALFTLDKAASERGSAEFDLTEIRAVINRAARSMGVREPWTPS